MKISSCPYRQHESGDSRCRFITDLLGDEQGYLGAVDEETCRACLEKGLPDRKHLNPVVASSLFMATARLQREEGIGAEELGRISEIQEWAKGGLQRAYMGVDEGSVVQHGERKEKCFYLGDQVGERDCSSCSGSVRMKEFRCEHEDHELTVIRNCMRCWDYEKPLKRGGIETWSVGMTTAPRRESTLKRSLQSLRDAGWSDLVLFAEPGIEDLPDDEGIKITRRRETMGAWPNFFSGLGELVLSNPGADAYFMCQDDVVFSKGLRRYLEGELWPKRKVGVVSLHTPSHQTHCDQPGFFERNVGWSSWGAMGFVFSNASARAILRCPGAVNHRSRGPRKGLKNVDSVVGFCCKKMNLPYFLHRPSLAEHIGLTTTLWENDSLDGRRSSSDFPGEEVDISTLMADPESFPGHWLREEG